MVRVRYFNEAERCIAAAAVEDELRKLSKELGIVVDNYVWNLDQGMNHCGPHRLDVHFCGHVLRIYFTDHELAAYWGLEATTVTDTRLRELMAHLYDLLHDLESQQLQDDPLPDSDPPGISWLHRPKNRFRWRAK